MVAGSRPFSSKNREQMFRDILKKPVQMKAFFSRELSDLLKNLLMIDPAKRLADVSAVKAHPFFTGLDWEACAHKVIPPPFKPAIFSDKDLRYFDTAFVSEAPVDSPVESALNINQKAANRYDGFTYKEGSQF